MAVATRPQQRGSADSTDDAWDTSCTVLLVGTDDWAIEQAATSLEASGSKVLRCHEPNEPTFPCNAFIPGRTCPLDAGFDVVLTIRARPSRLPEPGETGVVCALRTGHPLVVGGVTQSNPFADVATSTIDEAGDLAAGCRAVTVRARTGADERDRVGISSGGGQPAHEVIDLTLRQ